jgi:nucleoid-associated protein YgaU
MNRHIIAAAALVALAGCSTANKHTDTADANIQPPNTVTDVGPAPASYQTGAPTAPSSGGEVAMSATPSGGGGTTYTVQPGDSLYKIARQHYGDPKAWKQIAAANPQINGTLIKPGQKIVLP